MTCPFCNSSVPLPPGTQPGQRLTCPRCGEAFTYRGPTVSEALQARPSAPPPSLGRDVEEGIQAAPPARRPLLPPAAPRRRSNVLVALAILGLMGLVALVAWSYALETVEVRREHDVALPKSRAVAIPVYLRALLGVYVLGLVFALLWGWNRSEREADRPRPLWQRLSMPALALVTLLLVGVGLVFLQGRPARPTKSDTAPTAPRRVAPAELTALGYLPPDTNFLVALHVAEALEEEAGRQAMDRLRIGNVGAEGLESWVGVKRDELDHAVLGLTLDEQLLPRRTVVARTRQPYDPAKVRTALKTNRTVDRGGRTLHRFTLESFGVDAYLWFADERALVVAGKPEDFDRIPSEPRRGIDHLPEEVRTFLTTRMGPTAQAWMVGHVASWEKVGAQLFLAGLLRQDWETWRGVRTFGGSLLADGRTLTFDASFRCADEAAATRLRARFAGDQPGDKPPPVPALGGKPEAEPLLRELRQSLKVVQDSLWVQVQARATVPEKKP